jgi:hypothetical protein
MPSTPSKKSEEFIGNSRSVMHQQRDLQINGGGAKSIKLGAFRGVFLPRAP